MIALLAELAPWLAVGAAGATLAVAAVIHAARQMDRCTDCGSTDGPLHYFGPHAWLCPTCCWACANRERRAEATHETSRR